jgi:hypothetical protein
MPLLDPLASCTGHQLNTWCNRLATRRRFTLAALNGTAGVCLDSSASGGTAGLAVALSFCDAQSDAQRLSLPDIRAPGTYVTEPGYVKRVSCRKAFLAAVHGARDPVQPRPHRAAAQCALARGALRRARGTPRLNLEPFRVTVSRSRVFQPRLCGAPTAAFNAGLPSALGHRYSLGDESGRCLSAAANASANSPLTLAPCDDSDAQLFAVFALNPPPG